MKRLFFAALMLLSNFGGYAQFKAKMEISDPGNDMVYTVYSDRDRYRYEFTESSQPMVLIIKPRNQTTLILFPAQKMFMKMNVENMMNQGGNDPLKNYNMMKKTCTEKSEGKEVLEGYLCEKRVLSSNDKKMMTVWYSEVLNFPVKIVDHQANSSIILKDIVKWDPDPAFFEVPENYTGMMR